MGTIWVLAKGAWHETELSCRRTASRCDRGCRVQRADGRKGSCQNASRHHVIDQHNYHLFQPLLYQVATASLSLADIASPIRTILRRQQNTSVMLAQVTDIDTTSGEVMAGNHRIPFDYLVLAPGAHHAYFGHDEWETHARGIKTIDDATALRRKILLAFEKAEFEADPEERRCLLTFAIIGGGATGVEMAGAMAELARKALATDFRSIDPTPARTLLIEAGPRLLPVFEERLSEAA